MSRQVSIIIVNYNTGSLLYNCLESIRTHVSSTDVPPLLMIPVLFSFPSLRIMGLPKPTI